MTTWECVIGLAGLSAFALAIASVIFAVHAHIMHVRISRTRGSVRVPVFRLKKDLVIPAGTIFHPAPRETKRFGTMHYDAEIGLTPNTSGTVTYFLGDDIALLSEWFEELK